MKTIDEIENEMEKLNKRHDELMNLDSKEFLSESVTKELDYIHTRTLELIRLWPKTEEP